MNIEQKTNDVISESMQDVIQELLIIDESDVSHLVYIHHIDYKEGKMQIEFSTPDENKEALKPLVHAAMMAQMGDIPKEEPLGRWGRFKNRVTEFLMLFSRLA